MEYNKSQLTIFAILAIASLIGAGFFLMVVHSPIDPKIARSQDEVSKLVNSCLERTLKRGAFFIAGQGGYYHTPENSIRYGSIRVPYYHHHQSGPSVPTLEDVESELSNYIIDELPSCIEEFKSLEDQGYSISKGEMRVKATIAKNDVLVSLEYPLTVSKGEDTISYSFFSSQIPLEFSARYEIIKGIVSKQQEGPNYAPLGHLAVSAYENRFFFEVEDLPDSTMVFMLIFNETERMGELFIYTFAAQYDWKNLTNAEEEKVMLEPIPIQEAYVGYPFEYQAHAKGNNVLYEAYTDLFSIDGRTGRLRFIPTNEQGGNYLILIKATDNEGNTDVSFLELEVKGYSRPPVIEKIPDFNVPIGQQFSYDVKASDEDNHTIFFLDNSSLFIINPISGKMEFTPSAAVQGEHLVKVTATDTSGLSADEEFKIRIE